MPFFLGKKMASFLCHVSRTYLHCTLPSLSFLGFRVTKLTKRRIFYRMHPELFRCDFGLILRRIVDWRLSGIQVFLTAILKGKNRVHVCKMKRTQCKCVFLTKKRFSQHEKYISVFSTVRAILCEVCRQKTSINLFLFVDLSKNRQKHVFFHKLCICEKLIDDKLKKKKICVPQCIGNTFMWLFCARKLNLKKNIVFTKNTFSHCLQFFSRLNDIENFFFTFFVSLTQMK